MAEVGFMLHIILNVLSQNASYMNIMCLYHANKKKNFPEQCFTALNVEAETKQRLLSGIFYCITVRIKSFILINFPMTLLSSDY